MTETANARPRRAALFGLILQLAAFAVILVLAHFLDENFVQNRRWNTASALHQLAWYVLGGAPIWLIALLIFRQRELAELEAIDLEQLRREKRATGGGEGMFDEGGGASLGFRVAENRLQWMQKWYVPAFGLLVALYLIFNGWRRWRVLPARIDDRQAWDTLANVPMGMILLSIIMLFLLFYSRYTSGMGRVPGWQLLRACGSYMLGNALAAIAVVVCLGIQLYTGSEWALRWLAYLLPGLMVLLGAETLLNFILDIYRPRAPGTEPRAAFDSRLLGLISEPGGIAHSIAEAINYQFGFQVSQTWFYQLLQRRFPLLLWSGILALWALTWFVVVQPDELAIIELNGRPVNAEQPLEPGFHWKWPWPFAVAHKYNVGQLHQLFVGGKTDDIQPPSAGAVVLWTDEKHGESGSNKAPFEEFNFIVARRGGGAESRPATQAAGADTGEKSVPVHLLRMTVAIQYRILPAQLNAFSRTAADPQTLLRNLAWQELVRHNAAANVDALLGEQRTTAGETLRRRINARLRRLDLGLEVVYVGLQDVHPEKTVAEAFRNAIGAEQEKISAIRKARVDEEQKLSRVAGGKAKALALVQALNNIQNYELQLTQAERALQGVEVPADLPRQLEAFAPQFTARIEARHALEQARLERDQVEEDYDLGLDRSARQRETARQRYAEADKRHQEAAAALEQALTPLRGDGLGKLDKAAADALLRHVEAKLALAFWNRQLELQFQGLEGEAAVALAQAQAKRWETEMRAAAEVTGLTKERHAYAAAPEVYKARRYLQTLADGMRNSRKYFLAFDPTKRDITTRIEAQEQARPDITDAPVRPGQ